MDNQLSIFDNNNDFENNVNSLLTSIIVEEELPSKSLQLISNVSLKGENKGKEISKTICICEPEYPSFQDKNTKFTIKRIIKIEQSEFIDLLISNAQYKFINLPLSATIKKNKSDKDFVHIIFNYNDKSIFQYIKECVLYNIKNYFSSSSFSCCSKFIVCSDAKKCVHENKLYATGCFYRMNLENGKIFYGINKNI